MSAVPAILLAAAWCVLPGLSIARALGWRGVAAWGSAPLLSIGLVATTAVVGGRVGIPWGPWPVVVATAVCVAVAFTGRVVARRRSTDRPAQFGGAAESDGRDRTGRRWSVLSREGPDGLHAMPALAVGTVVGIALCWLTVVIGFGPVNGISATYDAVHHYSAVARILATGDGSSLTLGQLTTPGRPTPYPAAWHDLVALVVTTSGASIPVASNVVALVVASVVWPLSGVLLVRQLVGRRAGALLLTPVLATAFTAMPWAVMSWGVLWPNLLGVAVLPAGLAAVVTVLGLTRESAISRPGALLVALVSVPALGLAQPNAVVGLAVVGLSPLVYAASVHAVRLIRERRPVAATASVGGALAAVLTVLWLLAWSPFLAGVRTFDWPVTMGAAEALRGVLLNAMNGRPAMVVVSFLVVVGAVSALRRAHTGWLVPAHLVSGFLYVLAASRDNELSAALTGAWYNDSYRLAAMVPVTGLPLAAIGLLALVGLLARATAFLPRLGVTAERRRLLTVPVTAVVVAGLVLMTDGFRVGVHAVTVADTYQRDAAAMLAPGQRDFLVEAGRLLPADAVVAANPWTGNALLYPLTGREAMFPHLSGSWTPEQQVVRERLRDAGRDPAVCAAVRATGLTHAIDGPVSFWPWDKRSRSYPGLAGLDGVPGFERVTSGGGSALYRITACGPLQGSGRAPRPDLVAFGR